MSVEDVVKGVDIKRYNVLNIRLRENNDYAVKYQSGDRKQLNPFEELYHLGTHVNLANPPLLMHSEMFHK